MTRKRLVLLGLIAACLTVGILIGTHASAGRRSSKTARVTVSSDSQSDLVLEPMPPQDGALVIRARLWLSSMPVPYPPHLWWYLEVRARDDNGKFAPVWTREYKQQQFFHDFKSEHTWTFADRIAMPPGLYQVYVSVREDWP